MVLGVGFCCLGVVLIVPVFYLRALVCSSSGLIVLLIILPPSFDFHSSLRSLLLSGTVSPSPFAFGAISP